MAEADPFAAANEAYTIVIAGHMNPAIHHPAWYKLINALSQDELASTVALDESRQLTEEAFLTKGPGLRPSTGAGVTICTPPFAQFTAGKMRITCIDESWTITTPDQNLFVRIRDIASTVFEALSHTPVSAYGLNFNFHRGTSVGNVGARLAQIIDGTQVGFPKGIQGSRSAKVGYTVSDGARALNVSVEPSVRGNDMIFVGINAHHPIVLETGVHQFDLTPLLRDSTEKDLLDAQEVLSWVMQIFGGNGKE